MRLLLTPLAFLSPLCLGDGIVAGFHGIYTCSDIYWKGTCIWHEIEYADIESQKCIHLHSDHGFGSMGPDKSLGAYVWDSEGCLGDPLPMLNPLTCPGSDLLGSQHVNPAWKDLWVKVRVLKRKDMKNHLPDVCDFKD